MRRRAFDYLGRPGVPEWDPARRSPAARCSLPGQQGREGARLPASVHVTWAAMSGLLSRRRLPASSRYRQDPAPRVIRTRAGAVVQPPERGGLPRERAADAV